MTYSTGAHHRLGAWALQLAATFHRGTALRESLQKPTLPTHNGMAMS
jgi:hypothetical protein